MNVQGTNDQENARVALLKNGGAVFVWQGGHRGFQQIYARFLTPTNTWLTTNDVLVNTPPTTNVSYSYSYATNITLTVKTNKVHGKTAYTTNATATVVTTVITNLTLSGSFRANPAVATLANSNVVVVWASFNQAGPGSLLDVYGQVLDPGRPEGWRRIFSQPIHRLQPAVTSRRGVEKRRVCRRLGVGTAAGGF